MEHFLRTHWVYILLVVLLLNFVVGTGAPWVQGQISVIQTPPALDDLIDVNAPGPTDNDSLTWDAATQRWIPDSVAGGSFDCSDLGTCNLTALGDVDVPSPPDGYVLYWDASTSLWKCKSISEMVVHGNEYHNPAFATEANLTATQDNVTALQDLSHTQGTDTTLGTLTADVDFAGYMAIAMVCDNGATVPASPVAAQWFLHTPTGRKVLMQYSGTDWISIMSIGTMTVYVDNTDGTDAMDYGGEVDGNAFETVQYAIDRTPGLIGGHVSIYINDEDYAETVVIRGKQATGDYTITLYGTFTSLASGTADSKTTGSTTVQGTLTDTGAFGAYDNKLVYITATGEYRVIDSDDADTLTICGTFADSTNLEYMVYDWGTTINGINVMAGQQNVVIQKISMSGFTANFGSSSTIYYSQITGSNTVATYNAAVTVYYSYLTCAVNGYTFRARDYSNVYFSYSKITNTYNTGICLEADYGTKVSVTNGCVIDGYVDGSNKANYGIGAIGNSLVICYTTASHVIIRNCDYGIYSIQGAQVVNTNNLQLSGNTIDAYAQQSSYGYVANFIYYQQTVTAKTTSYTCLYTDSSKVFTDTGAGAARTFTLPAVTYTGWTADFVWVSGNAMVVASAEGDNMVLFNDATADSISFATAGEIIGNSVTVISDGTRWLCQVHLATETATPTIVT